jgi:hypothetical protein
MTSWRSVVDQSQMAARLVGGLPRFLRQPRLGAAAGRRILESGLRRRSQIFLELVRRGVYEHAASPYLPLLRQAGITYDDCARLVGEHGIERMLDRLYDAGVHVTLDEFKGRRPIQRGRLTVATEGRAFDNPLLTRHYEARTGGSRSPGTRFIVDLELLEHDAAYDEIFLDMFDLRARPGSLWHPAPPGSAGLKWALRFARLGHPISRWFSQTPVSFAFDSRQAAFVRMVSLVSRASGRRVPQPEHVPLREAVRIASWLAACRAQGAPAWMSTTASAAVRLCLASRAHGLDISGTFFRSSGEPLSPGKARLIADAGCVARCHYAMAEIGRMAVACGRPATHDDVHVASDKVAFLQREIAVGGARVPGLLMSSLLWSVPKVMLNVELGDYAVRGTSACGCVWETLGFTDTLHTIRSYEKLTSEGMHFLGVDLITLVDEALPARFGGHPTDYQFVEEEREGLPAVSLLVSPRVGPVDEAAVRAAVLEVLAAPDAAHRMMAALWRDAAVLQVARREPHATRAGKILPLHVGPARPRPC